MSKKPANHGKSWTAEDIAKIKDLAGKNTPTGIIGLKLGRTEKSIYGKANENKISLHPTNKSPYDRKVANSKKK